MIHTRLNVCSHDLWVADPTCVLLCSVDPITLTGLALGALGAFGGAAAAGAFSGSSAPAAPQAPAPPASVAPPQAQPQAKPKPMQQPSFVGAAAAPVAGASGQKTLLGQ